MRLGDQDKSWAPHKVCRTCVERITTLVEREKKCMPFFIPMIWREPRNLDRETVKTLAYTVTTKITTRQTEEILEIPSTAVYGISETPSTSSGVVGISEISSINDQTVGGVRHHTCPTRPLNLENRKSHVCQIKLRNDKNTEKILRRRVDYAGQRIRVRYFFQHMGKPVKEYTNLADLHTNLKQSNIRWNLYKHKITFDPNICCCCTCNTET